MLNLQIDHIHLLNHIKFTRDFTHSIQATMLGQYVGIFVLLAALIFRSPPRSVVFPAFPKYFTRSSFYSTLCVLVITIMKIIPRCRWPEYQRRALIIIEGKLTVHNLKTNEGSNAATGSPSRQPVRNKSETRIRIYRKNRMPCKP